MKRLLLAAVLCGASACRVESDHARGPASTDFYGELAPYGTWVDLPPYGAVWQPAAHVVGPDFYPYFTGGWWVNTEYGWSWDSAYAWGWIPFHHGRWVTAPSVGWVWVPGDEWAPAWVEWRVGGGNVGWVPLGPQGVTSVWVDYHPRWCFVPLARFPSHNFHAARIPAYQEYAAYHSATSIPFERGDWRRGPSVDLVRRAGGRVETMAMTPRTLKRGDVRAEPRMRPGVLPPAPPIAGNAPPPPGQARRLEAPPPPGAIPPPLPHAQHMPPPPGAPAPPPLMRPNAPGALPPPPPGSTQPQSQARKKSPGRPPPPHR